MLAGGFQIHRELARRLEFFNPLVQRLFIQHGFVMRLYRLFLLCRGSFNGGSFNRNAHVRLARLARRGRRAHRRHLPHRRCALKFLQQSGKLQLTEHLLQRSRISRLHFQILDVAIERHFSIDRHQLAAQQGLLFIIHQLFVELLFLDLIDMGVQLGNRPVLLDQLGGRLGTHPLDTGNVVAGVTHQSHHFDHLVRRHAELFHHVRLLEALALHRVQHVDRRRDQLHHVLVAADDGDRQARRFALFCQCADDVVRLKPRLS